MSRDTDDTLRTKSDKEARVSLAPLDPEEALRALLKVDPHIEPASDDEREEAHPQSR